MPVSVICSDWATGLLRFIKVYLIFKPGDDGDDDDDGGGDDDDDDDDDDDESH